MPRRRLTAYLAVAVLALLPASANAASNVFTNAGPIVGPGPNQPAVWPEHPYPECCDNLVATDPAVRLNGPGGMSVHPSGYVFGTGGANNPSAIWYRRGSDGHLIRLAGADVPGCPLGDGGPARNGCLLVAHDVTALNDGSLLISDTFHERVRFVNSATGNISTNAGTGVHCQSAGTCQVYTSANAKLATQVDLCYPVAVEPVQPPGNGYYIADHCANPDSPNPGSNQVLWKRNDGKIVTSAGSTAAGYVDGAALSARFHGIADVRMLPDASGYLVSDGDNCRIREVKNGVVTTVAGSGPTPCHDVNAPPLSECLPMTGDIGDGGPPLLAKLFIPAYIDVTSAGGIVIADQCNDRIRYVYPDRSKIITIAGSGEPPGWNGDGPALSTRLAWPDAVIVSEPLHGILVSDLGNNRVRFVSETPPG